MNIPNRKRTGQNDSFEFLAPTTSRNVPCFQTVRTGQNSKKKKSKKDDESISETHKKISSSADSRSSNFLNYSSVSGSIQFPTAYRSNKSHTDSAQWFNFTSTSRTTSSFWLNFTSSSSKVVTSSTGNSQANQQDADTGHVRNSDGSILSLLQNPDLSASNVAALRAQYQQRSVNLNRRAEIESANNSTPATGNRRERALTNKSSSSGDDFFSTPVKRPTLRMRPKTSSLKTPTSTSTTSSADSSIQSVVMALTEGRGHARGEMGIAAMDLKRPYLILCQISDSQTYVNTLRKINILNPVEIIIPDTFYENLNSNKLYQVLSERFPRVRILTVQRKYFKDTTGLQQVQSLCLEEYSSVLSVINKKVYTLAAVASLLKYAEYQKNMIFSPKSLRIDYQSGDKVMFIDLRTSENLELVTCHNTENTLSTSTLFGVLNKCSTIGGQRRLRALILQPPTEKCEVEARVECVQELIENQELYQSMKALLPKFWDIEQLLSLCGQISNLKDSESATELQINYILLLKTSLEVIPALKSALSNTNLKFFSDFRKSLDNEHYNIMLYKIYQILNDDAHLSQRYDINLFQRCFAIKTGINSFLDIARIAYTELVQDFNEIVEGLIEEHHLPLDVKMLKSKGPVLQLKKKNSINFNNLPKVFIQIQKNKHIMTMTTKDLLFLKERMNHFIQEIELLSSSIIFETLREIRKYIGTLYKFCENIAELDLVVAFAQVSKHFNFVRPQFTNDRMDVRSSVHPILNHISSFRPTPNDIIASIDENVCIITGPNMGGKSIYIRQVALLQIMAQIGVFVPAESAVFRLTDSIFSRIGFQDNIECNASTFIVEMQEIHYILQHVTPRSIVIIDELCRGTSTEEGTALAWAIVEELLATNAFVFLATHFFYLTKLQDLYCNVLNYHFEALEITSESNEIPFLTYTHRLLPGVSRLESYGLKLARSTAIPHEILQFADQHVKQLTSNWKTCSIANESITKEKRIDNIILKLLNMVDNETLSANVIKEFAEHIKETRLLLNEPNSSDRRIENVDTTLSLSSFENDEPYSPAFEDAHSDIGENQECTNMNHSSVSSISNAESDVSDQLDKLTAKKNNEDLIDKTVHVITPVNESTMFTNEDIYFSDCITGDERSSFFFKFNDRRQNRRNCFTK